MKRIISTLSILAISLAGLAVLVWRAPVAAAQDSAPTPRVGDERLVLRTIAGDLVLALYPDVAPINVAQVLELARLGVYDGTHFYRVHPQFVAQISDAEVRLTPLTREQKAALRNLPLEASNLKHRPGIVTMARYDDPNSARSSFSIVLGDSPHLDNQYTIIGHVESGMDVIAKMLEVPAVAPAYHPAARITVHKVEVVSAADLARIELAKPMRVPVSELDMGRVTVRQPQAQGVVVYGLMLMFGIGLLQFFLAPRLSARRLLSINLINMLVCGFLLIITVAPLAMYQGEDPDSKRLVALFLFVGILGVIKLMGRFETPE